MAKIKSIEIQLERTINIGNFENIKPSIKIVYELSENDNEQHVMDQAWKEAKKEIHKQTQIFEKWAENR